MSVSPVVVKLAASALGILASAAVEAFAAKRFKTDELSEETQAAVDAVVIDEETAESPKDKKAK